MEKSSLLNGGGGGGSSAMTTANTTAASATSSLIGAQPSNSTAEAAKEHGEEPVTTKSINNLGSFSLLINNLIGPAMLGFPNLFQRAGLVPTLVCIVFIYLSATLSGTMMADAISNIPGNKNYGRNVDFSSAFRIVMGDNWYFIAEVLFLVSCSVQAFASIVETAQSLDGFLASFLLGKTYALQLAPTIELVSWEPTICREATELGLESSLEDCTPFYGSGPLIISLGFLITTALFLPLGRGNLKETIGVQLIAFGCLIVLLTQFSFEFVGKGFPYQLPLFTDHVSQLAGVVLFNYAFIITVPSWLVEKKEDVSVNKLVWGASTSASLIYIGYGIMGAMTFQSIGTNSLVLLTSSKVHFFTRICAAFFGVSIIGSGVPVLCVIIRTALYHSNACSYRSALFLGSVFPYMVCWMLYQGSLLMTVLNWTGLIVNGLVAFMLPMVLVLRSLEKRKRKAAAVASESMSAGSALLSGDSSKAGEVTADGVSSSVLDSNLELTERKSKTVQQQGGSGYVSLSVPSPASSRDIEQEAGLQRAAEYEDALAAADSAVQPLPAALEPYRRGIVIFMLFAFGSIMVMTIVNDVVQGDGTPDIRRYL